MLEERTNRTARQIETQLALLRTQCREANASVLSSTSVVASGGMEGGDHSFLTQGVGGASFMQAHLLPSRR